MWLLSKQWSGKTVLDLRVLCCSPAVRCICCVKLTDNNYSVVQITVPTYSELVEILSLLLTTVVCVCLHHKYYLCI